MHYYQKEFINSQENNTWNSRAPRSTEQFSMSQYALILDGVYCIISMVFKQKEGKLREKGKFTLKHCIKSKRNVANECVRYFRSYWLIYFV